MNSQILEEVLGHEVDVQRKEKLQVLINYLNSKQSNHIQAQLNFICTHNSRRSQFAQLWAQVAASHFRIAVNCYSGGVEITEFNKRAIASLKRFGFQIKQKGDVNPHYSISYNQKGDALTMYSKLHDDPANPNQNFVAIMTCSHADENCPFIPGAEQRISITYEDPKAFDGTDLEETMYDQRSMQIASEMFYVFSQVK